MRLRMWTYDIAREQSPTLDHLRQFCELTRDAGFNAIGLYLEHRFAYPSTPWSHGAGCVTPEMVSAIEREYPEIAIIPFVNLLGHMEGFLYTEEGRVYAEELFQGMQACPSNDAFVQLATQILDDTIACFRSELIHIGGDETWQLGACPRCAGRAGPGEGGPVSPAGKSRLYAEHFAPLAQRVIQKGRRPAVWGDMFLEHTEALAAMPKETLIFDWQYFKGSAETSLGFRERGFEVVCCPALHTYNAAWFHLPQSEENVLAHARDAVKIGAHGVCVTTWEEGLFGAYDTLFPAIRACGRILKMASSPAPTGIPDAGPSADSPKLPGHGDVIAEQMMLHTPPTAPYQALVHTETSHSSDRSEEDPILPAPGCFLADYRHESERHEEWARLMGEELASVGGMFAFSGIRSSLKCRLLLYSNPFLAWLHHGRELKGEVGERALEVLDRAISVAPTAAHRGVSEFVKLGVDFVRFAEDAHQAYANRLPGVAVASLAPCRQIFESLANIARASNLRIGGSLADVERCRIAREHVERVMLRVKEYGDGSLGYLPSFEMLTHPKFVPHDQAAWWLINRWANQ